MGKDSEELIIQLIGILFAIAIGIIVFILVCMLFIVAIIGLITLNSWLYKTEWGKQNRYLLNLTYDKRNKEDYYFPGIVWSAAGVVALVPTGLVITSLQAYYNVEEVLSSPYLPVTGPIILIVLILTIASPLPYRIYRSNKKERYINTLKKNKFKKSQFKSAMKIESESTSPTYLSKEKSLLLAPFYCQLCGGKHPAGTPRFQCQECGRNLCTTSFSDMIAAGRTTCPMCDGTLIATNQ